MRSGNRFDVIAFDADDTLWHNETLYANAQGKLAALLAAYANEDQVYRKLFETEEANLPLYGYGIKSFALSMIETAVDLSAGKIAGLDIRQIIGYMREMLEAEVQLIDGVDDTIDRLAKQHRLMVITKGDLLDQRSKLARSKLAQHFSDVQVVSDKSAATYQRILDQRTIQPERFLMVGNSIKSDILPVLALGGYAVHIPYHITWAHEQVTPTSIDLERLFTVESVTELPKLIDELGEY